MQNLNEGDSVSVDGKIATVAKVHAFTVEVILEDGTRVTTHRANVQPRSFLTESN